MKRIHFLLMICTLVFPLLLSACQSSQNSTTSGSGMLSATEVLITPEIGGRVVEILVAEGDNVQAGDPLFRIEDDLLQAQADQAQAAVAAATATLSTANAQLALAQVQHDIAVQGALVQDVLAQQSSQSTTTPDSFQPAWYFQPSETLEAARAEVDTAQAALEVEQANLINELDKASNQDFSTVEQRLAQAQAAYLTAQATLDLAQDTNDDNLIDAAQELMDAAQAELDVADLNHANMLNTASAEAILNARARVAVAQIRLDNARYQLAQLQTGDDSLQVIAAQAAVDQASAALGQAEANLVQAQASVQLINLQLERTEVKAPSTGRVLARNLEVGEIVVPGSAVMSIAPLDQLNLIVYLPEDQYGQVQIGDPVNITVDSFPNKSFSGQVIRISDEAEFTPRNVQTVEGRRATVYAIEISVPNPDETLKPGMPADVEFSSSG